MSCTGSCGSSAERDRASDLEKPHVTEPARSLETTLTWRDRLGAWRVRWRIGRSRYRIEPGLYRVGNPDGKAPVLVTANYKLTVDSVRVHLKSLDVWLLVLDTKGINVWCAAGKGTFGTSELIHRIQATDLHSRVSHRKLVLPQLGAVGVAAHEVTRGTGFAVKYGPVLARDIPAYLAAGMKASPPMRRVPFGWRERLAVVPVELVGAWKLLVAIPLLGVLLGLVEDGRISDHMLNDMFPLVGACLTGVVAVPLLLPYLPFRAFALKGVVAGTLWICLSAALVPMRWPEAVGTILLELAITTFLAMTFTGATTFTNEAGARLEVKRALPAVLIAATIGIAFRIFAVIV